MAVDPPRQLELPLGMTDKEMASNLRGICQLLAKVAKELEKRGD